MNKTKKRQSFLLSLLLCISMLIGLSAPFLSYAEIEADAKSLILIEAKTGKVLYENNADEKLPPASVTKVMTMLLVMEAVDSNVISLTDMVSASALAASMGGSQIYLEEGEEMSVEDLLKSVVIASANDAACALAEYIAGSHDEFVRRMNERALELGMVNTHFENTNGLDDTTDSHLTSARDIAIMSAELIVNHPKILEYSSIWQDSVRNGEFTLTNTNRLVRFYNGCNGLKTGSTSKAKFCISASACRDNMQLIAVVMGSSTRDTRNATAKALLDWGFANFSFAECAADSGITVKVDKGQSRYVGAGYNSSDFVVGKGKSDKIEKICEIPESVDAPVAKGEIIGKVIYTLDGEKIGETPIYALEGVKKMNFGEMFSRLIKKYFLI